MNNKIKPVADYITKKRPASYETLLNEVQKSQAEALWELSAGNITDKEKKEKVLSFIAKQIADRKFVTDILSHDELITKLYNDIEKYSILTEYLEDDGVEGINVNAWDNIRVTYHNGKHIKAEPFLSPNHAIVILGRLLQQSNVTIDEAVPTAEGSIGSNIRITAVISPIVDKATGIAVYIRKLRDKVFTTDEYVSKSFATHEVLNTIHICAKRGVSTLFLGKVNTGKTTLIKYALDSLPDDMQIITIESGAREMNLTKYDKLTGVPLNNVVHMITREHEVESMNITQEKLVVKALRLNPDVVSVAEMRDTEAYAAIEASNSGHTVISTAHAGSVRYGHKRIANLARKKYPTDFHTALIDACEAFPLGVFIHTGEDGIRRIMNVTECYVDGNDKIQYNTLWEFRVSENRTNSEGNIEVIGEYVQVNDPSPALVEQLTLYGITKYELSSLFKNGGTDR